VMWSAEILCCCGTDIPIGWHTMDRIFSPGYDVPFVSTQI